MMHIRSAKAVIARLAIISNAKMQPKQHRVNRNIMKKLLLTLSLSFPIIATTETPKDAAAAKEFVAKIKPAKTNSDKLARTLMIVAQDTAWWSSNFLVWGYIFGAKTPPVDRLKWGAILGSLWGVCRGATDFLSPDKIEELPTECKIVLLDNVIFAYHTKPVKPDAAKK
jgi:hypothetical protein